MMNKVIFFIVFAVLCNALVFKVNDACRLIELTSGDGTAFGDGSAREPVWSAAVRHKSSGRSQTIQPDYCATHAADLSTTIVSSKTDTLLVNLTVVQERQDRVRLRLSHRVVDSAWRVVSLTLSIPLGGSPQDALFVPKGWGLVAHRVFGIPERIAIDYPSSAATMQFFALMKEKQSLYVAAHDGAGLLKSFAFGPNDAVVCDVVDTWCSGVLSMRFPINESASGEWHQPFDVAIEPFAGNCWFDAALRYRNFVDKQPVWSKVRRPLPYFAQNLSLAFNSGWSPYDVLDADQGNPNTVLADAAQFRQLFPHARALFHWYMWYDGASNFDENYPAYFPAKKNFHSTVAKLREKFFIETMPYVNGRLFDSTLKNFSAVEHEMTKVFDGKGVHTHLESYGNDRAFAVPCPSQQWWQRTQKQVFSQIGDVRAIYVDQIAAATPIVCESTEHAHSPGGGTWWTHGNQAILRQASQTLPLVVTENNAETYLGAADIFLSVANWIVLPRIDAEFVPAFQSAHRVVTLGRVWDPLDFVFGANWLRSKSSQTFLFGSINGWFSWRGLVGVGEHLRASKQLVDHVNILSAWRQRWLAPFFERGRHERPLRLRNTVELIDGVLTRVPAVQTAVWAVESRLCIIIVNSLDQQQRATFNFVRTKSVTVFEQFLNGTKVRVSEHQTRAWQADLMIESASVRVFFVE